MEEALANRLGIRLMEQLFPGWVVLQCSDDGRSHRFISGNGAALFGFSEEELDCKSLDSFTELIHPDDLEPYKRIRQKIEVFASTSKPADMPLYRFVMQYRVRRGTGTYFYLYDEKQVYMNGRGSMEVLSLFRDISADKPFMRVQLDIFRVNELGYRKLSTYAPLQTDHTLTSREVEIIDLIKAGFSSKEIADRLFISINTVRNHRSNLFRKTNARNMVDLLNTAMV